MSRKKTQVKPLAEETIENLYKRINEILEIERTKDKIDKVMEELTGSKCVKHNVDYMTGNVSCIQRINVDNKILESIRDFLAQPSDLEVYAVVANYEINAKQDVSDLIDVERLEKIWREDYYTVYYREDDKTIVYAVYLPIMRYDNLNAYIMLKFIVHEGL